MRVIGKGSVASLLTVVVHIAWYVVALALTLTLCLALVAPFIDLSGGETDIPVSFSVDGSVLPVAAPSLDVTSARIERVRGSLIFPTRAGRALAGAAVTIVLMLAIALWVLGLLHSVLRTLRDGRPFVPANATRLRWIAWMVIGGEIARSALVFASNHYAMTHFSAPGLVFDTHPDLNLFAIINGLIILVIAEVFRAGTRLDEDQSLTV